MRRLSAARHEGFVVNLEMRRGMPGKYRLASQVSAVDAKPRIDMLPDAGRLESTHTSQSPPKIAQPCNRGEKVDSDQEDDGCDSDEQPDAPDATVATDRTCVAEGLATARPMNGQGKSLPVAGLHDFSGGTAHGVTASSAATPCLQCGAPLGPGSRAITVCSTSDGQRRSIHEDCLRAWQSKGPPQ